MSRTSRVHEPYLKACGFNLLVTLNSLFAQSMLFLFKEVEKSPGGHPFPHMPLPPSASPRRLEQYLLAGIAAVLTPELFLVFMSFLVLDEGVAFMEDGRTEAARHPCCSVSVQVAQMDT